MLPRIFFIFLLFSVIAGCALSTKTLRTSGTIIVLHTNDFHGRYLPFVAEGDATSQIADPGRKPVTIEGQGRIGGFAYLATALNELKQRYGQENILLLDAGDAIGDDLLANLTQGESMIKLMNAVGYQYMALGNHDFDYGWERTRALQQSANFPMRAANVLEKNNRSPFLGEPVKLFDVGKVRVAVLALGYHNTNLTGNPKHTAPLEFVSGIDVAKQYLPALKQRADVVIVLSHQGTKVDRMLAKEVKGIDVIVGGHSHDKLAPAEKIGNTWLVQALSDGAMLGEVAIKVAKGQVQDVQSQVHPLWNDWYAPDVLMSSIIEELRRPYKDQLTAVIANAAAPIARQYKSESPFDVLVGDILREKTGSEIAFLPGVGYGISLQPGPITREALAALLPHPSKLVTLKLSGMQILEILEQSATNQKPDDPLAAVGGLVQTSGLRWTVDLTRRQGKRIDQVFVGGVPLVENQLYSVVTHSGMLDGIHRYQTFASGTDIQRSEQTVFELVEEGLRQRATISPPVMGNITLIKDED